MEKLASFILLYSENIEHMLNLAQAAARWVLPLNGGTVYKFEDGSELTVHKDGHASA